MPAIKEPVRKVVKEGDLRIQMPLDPERVYTMLDGQKLTGMEVMELEREMRFTNNPLNAYFCPLCDMQLELTGAGWHCRGCGANHDEGDLA